MKRIYLDLLGALSTMSIVAEPLHAQQREAVIITNKYQRPTPQKEVIGTGGRVLVRHIKPSTWNQRKARKRLRQVPQLYKKSRQK